MTIEANAAAELRIKEEKVKMQIIIDRLEV